LTSDEAEKSPKARHRVGRGGEVAPEGPFALLVVLGVPSEGVRQRALTGLCWRNHTAALDVIAVVSAIVLRCHNAGWHTQ
jgi:hypothetical protein